MAENEDNEFRFITRSAERLRENPEALTAFLVTFRKSLIRIAVSVLGCSGVGYVFAQPILKYFHTIVGAELAAYGIPEAFLALLNVAFAVGVFVCMPLDVAAGNREDIKIFGTDYPTDDGTCIRDYIHVTDLADAHLRALKYLERGSKSEVFNLGNGNGFSVREVIEAARKVTGKKINATETDRRPGDPPVLVGSSKKAREKLKWQPRFDDLSQIITTAWKWHRKKL